MAQEDKELLLKDLCCRLPYGVKVNISASRPDRYDNFVKSINDATINSIDLDMEKCKFKEFWWDSYIVNVRPYLRPMLSMTEEEFLTLHDMCSNKVFQFREHPTYYTDFKTKKYVPSFIYDSNQLDYLISHHFDYRGLIEKGLALVAPKGMYE